MRRAALGLTLLLAGCASADPNLWLLYAKAAHTYGRIEAKAEQLCRTPIRADRLDFCEEAGRVQETVQTLTPIIQQELLKKKADWPTILKYVDVILGLAMKAL